LIPSGPIAARHSRFSLAVVRVVPFTILSPGGRSQTASLGPVVFPYDNCALHRRRHTAMATVVGLPFRVQDGLLSLIVRVALSDALLSAEASTQIRHAIPMTRHAPGAAPWPNPDKRYFAIVPALMCPLLPRPPRPSTLRIPTCAMTPSTCTQPPARGFDADPGYPRHLAAPY